jgi:hypothetical protein
MASHDHGRVPLRRDQYFRTKMIVRRVSPWHTPPLPSANRSRHDGRTQALRDPGGCLIQRSFCARPNRGRRHSAHIRSSIRSRVCVEISASSNQPAPTPRPNRGARRFADCVSKCSHCTRRPRRGHLGRRGTPERRIRFGRAIPRLAAPVGNTLSNEIIQRVTENVWR